MKLHERYRKWLTNRTPAELEFERVVYDYEERYFADLTMTAPSIRRKLLCYEAQADNGKFIKTEDEIFLSLSCNYWTFRLRKMPGCVGYCDGKKKTIYLSPGLCDEEHNGTILHEMIHAYESQLSTSVREWLLLDLYGKLSKRINRARLHRLMNLSTHSIFHEGAHGVLFLLKSLDLDLRLGWTLGTVFGYGRKELFTRPSHSVSAKG